MQGITDALIWGSASVASLLSGVIVAGASYTVLGFLGLALLAAPALLLVVRRPRLSMAAQLHLDI